MNVQEKRPRLGRGLEALLSHSMADSGKRLEQVPIEKVKPNPQQPRQHFNQESIESLSKSIQTHGLNQPIIVRKLGLEYEIVAGERRFRACLLAKMSTIPVIVKNISDQEAFQIALVENLEREDLDPIEEAYGYQRLIKEFRFTHQEIADNFGKSRSVVSNKMRLLNLPEKVQRALINQEIQESHARTLVSFEDEQEILRQFENMKDKNLNVRDIETKIQEKKGVEKQERSNALHLIEDQLNKQLELKLKIKGNEKKGSVVIAYKSEDQLKEIISFFNA